MIFFHTEAIITTNSIRMNQVLQDSIEKPAEPARSRHCVSERICRKCHWGNLGRRRGAMNWSQENCLIDGHRLTCERREGDLRLVPDDPHLCGVVSAAILCAVTLRAPRQGKDILQSLLSLTERGCFYLRTFRTQNCPSRWPRTYALQTYSFHERRRKCFQQKGTAAENSYF